VIPPLTLGDIPADRYSDYRYEVIFRGYKWDPQVGDANTVARQAVLIRRDEMERLEDWAEKLSEETARLEDALLQDLRLAKELGLPRKILKPLHRLEGYRRERCDRRCRHVRLMRFDFHPTMDGWAVSEVNSDVPGGLAEASLLPGIAARFFPGYSARNDVADRLIEAFRKRIPPDGAVAFVHATSYADDRQVMQFLADRFRDAGHGAILAAPDHIRFRGGRAESIAEGSEGPLSGIVRFFPLEWLANLPRNSGWEGYFDAETVSCNHPAAILAQSKRLPLLWDRLGVDVPAWRELLPATVDPRSAHGEGWIWKPALGRVGEGVAIPEAISAKELRRIGRAARRYPGEWVAQRRFDSAPLGGCHLCVGVFTVDGKRAGAYGRLSPRPRIDAGAQDIPLLVSEEGGTGDGQP